MKSNLQYADDLVARDFKQCEALVVHSQYAMPFGTQVGREALHPKGHTFNMLLGPCSFTTLLRLPLVPPPALPLMALAYFTLSQ